MAGSGGSAAHRLTHAFELLSDSRGAFLGFIF